MQSMKQCGCYFPLSGRVYRVQQALKLHMERTGQDVTADGDAFVSLLQNLFPNERVRKCCMMNFLTILDSSNTTLFYSAPRRYIAEVRSKQEDEIFYSNNAETVFPWSLPVHSSPSEHLVTKDFANDIMTNYNLSNSKIGRKATKRKYKKKDHSSKNSDHSNNTESVVTVAKQKRKR